MSLRNICIGMLASLAGATVASAAVVVPNGDFQAGTFASWATGSGASLEADAGPGGIGDWAAHLQIDDWKWHLGEGNGAIGAPQGLQPNTAYTVSFDLKVVPGSAGKIFAGLDSYPANVYPTSWNAITENLTAGSWQTISWGITTNSIPTPFGFFVWTEGAPGGLRNVYVDNVRVTAVPEPTAMAVLGLAGMAVLGRRRSA